MSPCRTGEGRGYGLPASLQEPVDRRGAIRAVGFPGAARVPGRERVAPGAGGAGAGAGATGTGSGAAMAGGPSEAASRSRAAAGSGSARLARPPVPASAPSPWLSQSPRLRHRPRDRSLGLRQCRRPLGFRRWRRLGCGRPGEPLALIRVVGDPDFATRRRSRGPRAREIDGILVGCARRTTSITGACQEHKASDRGTGYDEASNDGLHFLTC